METTYADLRDGDVLIDKSGGRWHVSGVQSDKRDEAGYLFTDFWLCDPRTKVRLHAMTKPAGDSVTVERIVTQADDVATLEAGWINGGYTTEADRLPGDRVTHEQAVQTFADVMPATIEVEATAAEVDAARTATEDEPVLLPLFESMTDLEQRSHLYVLHGVFAEDIADRKSRIELHVKAHRDTAAGKLRGRYHPHTHGSTA